MNVQNTHQTPHPDPTPAGGGRGRGAGATPGASTDNVFGGGATDAAPAATAGGGPIGSGLAGQNFGSAGGSGADSALRERVADAAPAATAGAGAIGSGLAGQMFGSPVGSGPAQMSGSPVGSDGARWSPSMRTAAPGRFGGASAQGAERSGGDHRITLESYLARFAEPEGYLDFARFGPVSSDVAVVLERAATTIRTRGWDALDEYDHALERAKDAASELLVCAPQEVGLVSSTSHGLAAAAFGFRGPGTVVVARSDFPAAFYPWLRAAERGGLAVRFADGPLTADRLRPLMDETVRAVCVCAVDAGSGFVAPVGDIKELIGAQRVLVVDAVQALGATPFEAEAADVVAAGGQKFLRAGWGAALLMVRERVAELVGTGIGGWAGVEDPLGEAPHPHPPRPGGTAHMFTNPDGPAVAAFGAALRLVLDTGVERIHARITETIDAIAEEARSAGVEVESHGSGIMRLRVPGVDPATTHAALTEAGLTTTLRGAWIRVSPHATSRIALADRVGAALRSVAAVSA